MINRLSIKLMDGKILFFLILIMGLSLRLYQIKKANLWFDELVANNYSNEMIGFHAKEFDTSKISYLLKTASRSNNSPIYTLLIYIYSLFFGGWESLRYISAIFGMLSIIMFYKLSKLLISQYESICALAIMAFSPFQIWYAQEAREYAFQCFIAILMVYFYLKYAERASLSHLILFFILAILNTFSSYYSIFLIIISWLLLFLRQRRGFLKIWLASLLVILVFLLPVLINKVFSIKNAFWLNAPELKAIPLTFAVLVLGYSANIFALIAGIIFFIFLYFYGAYLHYKYQKNDTVILLAFSVLPIILIYLISKFIAPIYLDRKFIIFTPFYYILLVKGISYIKNIAVKRAVVFITMFLMLTSLINYYDKGVVASFESGKDFYAGVHFKKRYADTLMHIVKQLDNKDTILANDLQSLVIMSSSIYRYRPELIRQKKIIYLSFYPEFLSAFEKASLATVMNVGDVDFPAAGGGPFCIQRYNGKGLVEELSDMRSFNRIWLVSSTWEKQGPISKNSLAIKKYINSKCKKIFMHQFDGIFMEAYVNKEGADIISKSMPGSIEANK